MTMIPMYKKCPKCGKQYSFNPDVGMLTCPYCKGMGKPAQDKTVADKLTDLFNRKK